MEGGCRRGRTHLLLAVSSVLVISARELDIAVSTPVGALMVACIVLGVSSILRRDVARHEAFMIRAYALAQGSGTQALLMGTWILITGDSVGLTRDLMMTLAWAINLGVAEWVVHRRSTQQVI